MTAVKILIQIDGHKLSDKKAIVNSIRGFVKPLAKRFGFHAEFSKTE